MIARICRAPFRLSGRVLRGIGARRVGLILIGAVLGALANPLSGPELRHRIALAVARRRSGAEPTVEERVRARLADNPRTWHLPQPEVVAVRGEDEVSWRIILAGEVADDAARDDLEHTAAAVTGVAEVDNRIRVTEGDT